MNCHRSRPHAPRYARDDDAACGPMGDGNDVLNDLLGVSRVEAHAVTLHLGGEHDDVCILRERLVEADGPRGRSAVEGPRGRKARGGIEAHDGDVELLHA